MFIEEALWIKDTLSLIEKNGHLKVANVGSSTAHFRSCLQPHIHKYVFFPLEQDGWQISHVDMKNEDGVDIVGDVTKDNFKSDFDNRYSLIICSNLLEHVEDIHLVIENLTAACMINGYILITVPYKYRKHPDPIDNMFRPAPEEIVRLFLKVKINVIRSAIITIKNKDYYKIKKSRIPLWGYRQRIRYYLGFKHKVSAVLLKVVGK